MKSLILMSLFLSSQAMAAPRTGVYHCQGTEYSTGNKFEVVTTPLKIEVFKNGSSIHVVNQDQNCMVISEKTEISDWDGTTVLTHMSAFEVGCDKNDMFRNNTQLIINKSSPDYVAALSIQKDFILVEQVLVYCK